MFGLVVLFFRSLASIARTDTMWLPAAAVQTYAYGLVESLPATRLSTRNSTRRIPEASLAFALNVSSCPRVAVVPGAGLARTTAGGVVSSATLTTTRALAVLPAVSVAIAEIMWIPATVPHGAW